MTDTQFSLDAFSQKIAKDIGVRAVDKPRTINLLSSMPGMGVMAMIKEKTDNLKNAGTGIEAHFVDMDRISPMEWADLPGFKGTQKDFDFDEINKAFVLVIDASTYTPGGRIEKDMIELIENSTNASVWIVGSEARYFNTAINEPTCEFLMQHKSKMAPEQLENSKTITASSSTPKMS